MVQLQQFTQLAPPREGIQLIAAGKLVTMLPCVGTRTLCHGCGKCGHLKRTCKSKHQGAAPSRMSRNPSRTTRTVNEVDKSQPEQEENELTLYHITSG